MKKIINYIEQISAEERWKGLLAIPLSFGLFVSWLEIVERWQIIGIICMCLMLFNTIVYLAVIILDTIFEFFKRLINHRSDDEDNEAYIIVPDEIVDAIMNDDYHHEIVLDTDGKTVIEFRSINKNDKGDYT